MKGMKNAYSYAKLILMQKKDSHMAKSCCYKLTLISNQQIQKGFGNITPHILLVTPEKLELVSLHTYSQLTYKLHIRDMEIFPTIQKNYYRHNMLATTQNVCPKPLTYVKEEESSH